MKRNWRRQWRLLLVVVLLGITAMLPAQRALAAQRCFPETQQCLEGPFLEYWEQNGGLPVFGFPLSPAAQELNWDTRQTYLTQWFERARFELHPENQRPYHVLLGRLGADGLRKASIDWRQRPTADEPQPGCLWFAETRHKVCDQEPGRGFRTYWETHGLEFDGRRGTSYEESLALFGQPLTEPALETNSSGDMVLTQWFERGRFEWHPTNPDPYRVLLGHLGRETRVPLVRTQNPGLRGELIVYAADGLHTVKADGSTARFLQAVTPSESYSLVLSPDGRQVAGRRSYNGAEGVTIMDLDGSHPRRLNADSSAVVHSWSPDGRRLVYSSGLEGRRGIYVINVDGTNEIKLMEGTPGLMPRGGSWSPDGQQIAFETMYSEHAIYVINADGSGRRKLASPGWSPQWAPGGRQIVFVSARDGNAEIYLVDADSMQVRRVTTTPEPEAEPRWSPDGTRLAFVRTAAMAEFAGAPAPHTVIVTDAAGSQSVPVLRTTGTYQITAIMWSPDNQYIAAHMRCSRLCGPDQMLAGQIDGSRVLTLLQSEQPGGVFFPITWLPDRGGR